MSLTALREVSPLAGLQRRSLGRLDVTAQSVAATAPSAALATTPLLVALNAGAATAYAYVGALGIALLVVSCLNQFTRRMVSTGSLYSFVAQSLGPIGALSAGVALLLGYALLAMSTLVLSTSYLLDLVRPPDMGFSNGRLIVAGGVLLLAAAAVVLLVRGIAVSSRVALAIEGASLLAITTVLALVFFRGGSPLVDASSVPLSAHGIGTGVALALTSFIGFESAAALGVEARKPFRTVPRALLVTVVGAGVLFVLGSHVEIATSGDVRRAGSRAPLIDLATSTGGATLAHLFEIGIAASGFACTLACITALARLLFTLAREGVLPASLGRTHSGYGTPINAMTASVGVIGVLPALVLAIGVSPWQTFSDLVTLSTMGYLTAYLFVCAAAPLFLRRIGELTRWPLAISGLAVALLTLVLVSYLRPAVSLPDRGLLIVFVCLLLVSTGGLLRAQRSLPSPLGAYDEVVADDLFAPSPSMAGPGP